MIIRAATGALQTTGTTPVSQNIVVGSGPGALLLPKAAIYELAGTVTLNTLVAGRRHSLGFTDGTTQRSIGTMAENAQLSAAADSGYRADTASVLDFPQLGSEALDGGADWNAWVAGGSTVRTIDLFATAVQAKAVYFFGDDIDAQVVEVTAGATSITGLAFAPNFAMALSFSEAVAWASNISGANSVFSMGYAVKTPAGGVQQVCYAESVRDRNAVATNGASVIRDDAIIQGLSYLTAVPVLGNALSISAWNSDGVSFSSAADNGIAMLLIRFKGDRKLWAGIRSFTEAAGDVAVTDPGISASAYFAIASSLSAKNTLTTSSADASEVGGFSHGVYTGQENVHCSGQATDNVSPSVTRSLMGSDAVFRVLSSTGGTYFAATHVSLDSSGFTLNISGTAIGDASPQVAFVVIGGVSPGWLPEIVHRRHRPQFWGPAGT